MNPDIFSYIKTKEAQYQTDEIRVGENWNWNMREHVQMIFHLKHSQFYKGENDYLRAFKNIMHPMLQLAYWTEDIDVKDVVFFIESGNGRVLSFLLKKYHDEVFVRKYNIDDLFDEITEQEIDYGGCIVQRTSTPKPEVKHLVEVSFADQTNLTGGAIGFKYNFSPDGLRKCKSKGWGEESNGADISIEELITLASAEKEASGTNNQKKNETTSKNIEVTMVRGSLPEHYLLDNDNMEDWYGQMQVVAFYTDPKGKKHGVRLYRKKAKEENIKTHTTQGIPNRALGWGAGEALIHPQIWTNFYNIHKHNLLEAGSKVPLVTDDPSFANRNEIQDMDNLEITTVSEGASIRRIDTLAINNIQLYSQAINDVYEEAQLINSAFDPILGKEGVSGTTFRGQERTVAQGRGSHDRNRGKRAKFIEELYRDYILEDLKLEILQGQKFLASLTADELSWIREQLATNYANKKIKKLLLDFSKPAPTKEAQQQLKQTFIDEFNKGGNQKMLEILREDFKDVEIRMGINIANKQKDLRLLTDKLLSIFQTAFANPQAFQMAMQNKALAKSFNDILEFSGLSQADFSALTEAPTVPPQPNQQPLPALAQQPNEAGQIA